MKLSLPHGVLFGRKLLCVAIPKERELCSTSLGRGGVFYVTYFELFCLGDLSVSYLLTI